MNTKTPFSVVQPTKHDHLDRPSRLPRPVALFIKILLFAILMIGLAFLGHVKIWIVAHPGTTLITMGVLAGFTILYNLLGLVPAEHYSQEKWPSTNRSW